MEIYGYMYKKCGGLDLLSGGVAIFLVVAADREVRGGRGRGCDG